MLVDPLFGTDHTDAVAITTTPAMVSWSIVEQHLIFVVGAITVVINVAATDMVFV